MKSTGQFEKHFLFEKERIESFEKWPFDDSSSCNKLKMAQAGFYWTGSNQEPDTATCFVCNKTLDGWEETDDPWKEHAKHAPQCLFVKIARPENEISIRQFLEICGCVIKKKVSRKTELHKAEMQACVTKMLEKIEKGN